jgi:hypothetical protein
MSNPNDLVVVFSGNTFEADRVKIELENDGIPAFLKDEIIGTVAPWHAAPGGVGAVKVTVAQRDIDKANSIIQQFKKSNTKEF